MKFIQRFYPNIANDEIKEKLFDAISYGALATVAVIMLVLQIRSLLINI